MGAARASAEDGDDLELDRRTNEFLHFLLDKGLVDLCVGEDGEFEFLPTCPHQRACPWR